MALFRKRIDGVEFGYQMAKAIDEATARVDEQMERRVGRESGALSDLNQGALAELANIRLFNTIINRYEFVICWIYALKELISISSNDRNMNKINHGFVKYVDKEYGETDEDMRKLHHNVKDMIDRDPICNYPPPLRGRRSSESLSE